MLADSCPNGFSVWQFGWKIIFRIDCAELLRRVYFTSPFKLFRLFYECIHSKMHFPLVTRSVIVLASAIDCEHYIWYSRKNSMYFTKILNLKRIKVQRQFISWILRELTPWKCFVKFSLVKFDLYISFSTFYTKFILFFLLEMT